MSRPAKIIPQKTIGFKTPVTHNSFTQNEAILYALGIGISQDPLKLEDLKYTYQLHDDFVPFPTMGTIINKFDLVSPFTTNPDFPQFNPFQVLHAQQRIQLVLPKLYPGRQYVHKQQIVDVSDKGKNAVISLKISSFLKNNEGKQQLAFINYMSIIIRGMGGFGFKGKGIMKPIPAIPKRNPDRVLKSSSYANQPFVYRLSGDINPLHVDPNISSLQNYQRPILHGLSSFGNCARVIVQQICNNDTEKIKAYQARFVGHVFPSENYIINVWKQGTTYVWEAIVAQRQTRCLIGSFELRQEAKL